MKSKHLLEILQQPRLVAALVGLIFMSLYFYTAPRVNVGYADSDELITVGYHLGVAHPPGYPLYIFLIYLATHLPLPISIAFKAHLLSIFLSGITIAVLYYTCYIIIKNLNKNNKATFFSPIADRHLLAFSSVSLLATSALYWIYSTVAEVFALHNLLIAIAILLSTKIYFQRQSKPLDLFLLALVFGISLSHHQTAILILPMIITLLWQKRKIISISRYVQLVFVTLFFFILPLTLLYIFDHTGAPVSWRLLPGISGWVQHIFRKEFSGLIVETGQVTQAYLPEIDIPTLLQQLPIYFGNSIQYFSVIAFLIGLIGFFQIFKYSQSLAILFVIGYLFSGPLFGAILGKPHNLGLQAIGDRLYLGGYMFLPIFFLFGIQVILDRAFKFTRILSSRRTALGATILLPAALVIFHIYNHFHSANLRDFNVISQTYSQMIQQLAPNSIVTCFSDPACFGLLYEQNVNRLRSDVTIVPQARPLVERQLQTLADLSRFNYPEEPYNTFDIITWSIENDRPVYAADLSNLYYDVLGISEGFIYYTPHGMYGQLTDQVPQDFPNYDHYPAEYFLNRPLPLNDKMRLFFLGNIARTYQLNAGMHVRAGFRDRARDDLNFSSNLYQKISQKTQYGTGYEETRHQIESGAVNERFTPGSEPITKSQFLELIQQWQAKNRHDVAHKLALGLAGLYPEDVEARLLLAQTYLAEGINWPHMALIEYQNALKLDPDNQTAQQKIAELSSVSQN